MFFPEVLIGIILILIAVIINNSYRHAVKNAQKNIINSLNTPTIVIDAHKKIVFLNAAAESATELTAKNAIGQAIETIKLYNPQELTPFTAYDNQKEQQVSQKLTLQKGNGDKAEFIATITKNALGAKDQIMITLVDISSEAQLEEMKVDFVSMAAHELRTPLTAIRGYASLLQMHYATNLDASAKELLTRLIVSTTNLANLIDNLLSVSRIERNDLVIETKPLDLRIIIKDIFSSFQQEAMTRRQNFAINMPDKLPLVMADPFRIGQVFVNLISNAIAYTPDAGNVSVTVADRKDHIEIAIKDNGEGIPKEALPRLFTKFFRVSGSLEQGSKGTGIGLFITKSIVESHKGKNWAESELGKGSTFTITLTVATPEDITQNEQKANSTSLTVKNGQGIIVRNNAVKN